MAHERFRVGTTKGGPMLPDIDFEACQAVRAGNLVFLVGLTGFDRDTMEFAGAGDPAAQAEKAMENARALLEEAGSRMEDICKITTYVTEREYRKDVYPVIARHLRGFAPSRPGLWSRGWRRLISTSRSTSSRSFRTKEVDDGKGISGHLRLRLHVVTGLG